MKELFVKAKIVFDRGRYWVSYLTFMMMLFVTVTNMKKYTYFQFLQGRWWLLILFLGSLLIILIAGYIELTKLGTYQKEAEIYARLNPVQRRILENQEKILKKLDELCRDGERGSIGSEG
jgi:type II secretory pathway component PulL